ncbi:hypothetical protein PGC34_01570 [Pseudomonas kribbensis]|uniref:hypothetical protein n=1 Tax=Pseudomonas kribbensis TaxID=1628086 RepID=UPI003BF8BD9F
MQFDASGANFNARQASKNTMKVQVAKRRISFFYWRIFDAIEAFRHNFLAVIFNGECILLPPTGLRELKAKAANVAAIFSDCEG